MRLHAERAESHAPNMAYTLPIGMRPRRRRANRPVTGPPRMKFVHGGKARFPPHEESQGKEARQPELPSQSFADIVREGARHCSLSSVTLSTLTSGLSETIWSSLQARAPDVRRRFKVTSTVSPSQDLAGQQHDSWSPSASVCTAAQRTSAASRVVGRVASHSRAESATSSVMRRSVRRWTRSHLIFTMPP